MQLVGKALPSIILGICFAGLIYSFHFMDPKILEGSNYYHFFFFQNTPVLGMLPDA